MCNASSAELCAMQFYVLYAIIGLINNVFALATNASENPEVCAFKCQAFDCTFFCGCQTQMKLSGT